MQPLTVRVTRARFALVSIFVFSSIFQSATADPGGDYQGWLWETGVLTGGGFTEEYCFARTDLAFAVDLNWTIGLIDDVCWGRTTLNTGRLFDNAPPFQTFSEDPDQSTRPPVSAGGNLYELYGEEFEQGQGQGEERFGVLMSTPSNDNLLMAGGYDIEDDQFGQEYFRYVDLYAKSTTATKNARTAADLAGTSWRVATYSHELSATNVNVEFALSTIRSLDLQANGACAYNISTVFPDFGDNGDVYSGFQFDDGVNFDDRTVRGGLASRNQASCTYTIDADKYLAVTRTVTRAEDPNNPFAPTTRYVVSDDNRHLVLAPATVTEDSSRTLTLGYRTASQLANNAIDSTYFFYLLFSEFGADGAGAIAAGFGDRDWQEFDALGRGKVVFDSTTVGATPVGESGTWYACNIDMAIGENEHEFTGSTTLASVALGQFTGENTDIQFDECDYQLGADGGVSMRIFLEDGEDPEDDFEAILRGYVNDNGEVIAMTFSDVEGDSQNINKDVALVMSLLGMKYTGDPDADADGDGFNNYEEFKMPLPPAPRSRDVTTIADVTGDSTPDIGGFIGDDLSQPTVAVYSGADGGIQSTYAYLNSTWHGVAMSTVRDANQDGTADDPTVAVLAVSRDSRKIRVETRQFSNGALLKSTQFLNQNWRAVDVVVVDDLNGDGNTNDTAIAVLAERRSDGRIQAQLRDFDSGALVSNVVYLNARWSAVAAAVADRSAIAPAGTLVPVIGVIAQNPDNGKRIMQSREAGSGAFDQNVKFLGSTWTYHDVSVNHDANNNGSNEDPVWQVLATRESDGVIRVQSRAVADGAFDSNIVILNSSWRAMRLDTGLDISGNGSAEMVISAERPSDETGRIHVKDFASRTTTINIAP